MEFCNKTTATYNNIRSKKNLLYYIIKFNHKISIAGKMKKSLVLIFCILLIYFLQGCITINKTIYLQNVKIDSPIKAPPLNITKDKQNEKATISVGVNFNNTKSIQGIVGEHSKVNNSGFFQVDTVVVNGQRTYKDAGTNIYNYNENNFEWNQSNFSMFVNADMRLSRAFAFSIGLNYAIQNQRSLYGGNFGFGIYSEEPYGALRIDFGLDWQQVLYDASSVVVTDISGGGINSSSVAFFEDEDINTNFNPYVSLTYNSKYEDAPINFFIYVGYFTQTLISYSPSTPSKSYYSLQTTVYTIDKRGDATAGFFNLTPGLYFTLPGNSRINLGIRILKETQIESSSKSLFIIPVFQYDISF